MKKKIYLFGTLLIALRFSIGFYINVNYNMADSIVLLSIFHKTFSLLTIALIITTIVLIDKKMKDILIVTPMLSLLLLVLADLCFVMLQGSPQF